MQPLKTYLAPETIKTVIEFYKDIAVPIDPGITTSMTLGKRRDDDDYEIDEDPENYIHSLESEEGPLW